MSNGNEPQRDLAEACAPDPEETLVEGYDPDLLAAVLAVARESGDSAPLLSFLKARSDPRLGTVRELSAAECPWPLPSPRRGDCVLATGGSGQWEISLKARTGQVFFVCSAHEGVEGFGTLDGLKDSWADGDGANTLDRAFGSSEPEGDVAEFDLSEVHRQQLEASFDESKLQVLLRLLDVDETCLRRWVAVTEGDIPSALHALRRPVDADMLEYVDPNLGWPARWLIALARRAPGRYAALMAALWADPVLRRAGYQVLEATHPGWTAMLPGFAPPGAAAEIDALVRRAAVRRACRRLDELTPGWQAALAWAVRGTGGPLLSFGRPG